MATADQLKSLIRSHWSDEPERFITVALQVAAHEASQGHGEVAREIRAMVDKARSDRRKAVVLDFPAELQGLVRTETPEAQRAGLVLPPELMERLERITTEYRQRDKLRHHSLCPRRKILLVGPPGTGKTLTARVLAHELRLPLHTVQVDRLVTKFMGESAAKLRQIFDLIARQQGVYFFDEFDAIGGGRSLDNDVGEMRRVLNALLQFIEQDDSDSVIVAATNSPELLDRALFRRFDDVLSYELPDEAERKRLVENVLGTYLPTRFGWKSVLSNSEGLSNADIDLACRDALKEAVLEDRKSVSAATLNRALGHRKESHPV